MILSTRTIARAFGVAFVVACSSTPPSNPATDDGQLGTISGDEIVGTLTYGQTSAPVTYTSLPRYRAFSFDGATGDNVRIDVRSTDGLAMAWLQSDTGETVAYDATGSNDATISTTLAASGAYLIVFREAALHTSTFTVSLALLPVIVDAGGDATADAADATIDVTDATVNDSASDATINDATTDTSDATINDATADTSDATITDATADTTDDADDAVADSTIVDGGSDVVDGASDASASCTFTRSLTGVNGCSLCNLPTPTTSTDPLSATIDDAGGGLYDFQIEGGTGRTLHLDGVTTEFNAEGCYYVFALDGVPPTESWTSNQLNVVCGGLSNALASASITVSNSDQLSISYSVTHQPGVQFCSILHGCVLETLSCSGTLTATQK
jgi:hypothetical protein